MKFDMYVDGYGYTEVEVCKGLGDIPESAIYYGFDDDYVFYLDEFSDTEIYAIPDDALIEDLNFEEYFDSVKADVAYCLGIDEYSDEWYELMDI